MSDTPTKMRFHVESRRIDAHRSESTCKSASITLDTDMGGNPQAFNPAELLLTALSACMIKGIERVVPILKFELRGVKVIVDSDSLRYVDGTEIDFVRQGLNEAFKFRNPNVRGECGCGESFNV